MKAILGTTALAGLLALAFQSHAWPSAAAHRISAVEPVSPPLGWAAFGASFGLSEPPPGPPAALAAEEAASSEISDLDVVDAHWMALTMWGEARSDGEAGMRAVGHVIDNRRRAGGRYVTDTVSEAYQFSCWNPGDPNRAAMLDVDALPADSRDGRMWRLARDLAEEIMAARSADPTGGALFYHAAEVAPAWSQGVAPVRRIGRHLFFRAVRTADSRRT